jgi:hypothetical protein
MRGRIQLLGVVFRYTFANGSLPYVENSNNMLTLLRLIASLTGVLMSYIAHVFLSLALCRVRRHNLPR